MFRDRDLAVRVLGTLLPGRAGARTSAHLTRALGGERVRYAAAAAGAAATDLLGDAAAGAAVEQRWVAALAADDLDACRAWARVGDACGDLPQCPAAGTSAIIALEKQVGCSCCASQLCGCTPNAATNAAIGGLVEAQRASGITPQCDVNGTLCGTAAP